MKAFLLIFIFAFLNGVSVFAQRFGYVDTQDILKAIPDYVSAQKQLESFSLQWQKEVDIRLAEIDKLSKAYQAEHVLLTDEMRKHRETEIAGKEKDRREFEITKFGVEGELFQQRIKLIKPIQEKVAKAIQAVLLDQNLDIIYDKAEAGILSANPRYDRTNDVIVKMGYKPPVAVTER